MPPRTRPSRPAFTIIEVLAVITVAGLLAASVVPAAARINDARRVTGVHETARLLAYARAHAASSGLPAGIRFDTDADTAELVRYDGASIILADPLGTVPTTVALNALYGSDLTATQFSGAPAPGTAPDTATLWFDHRGTPHLRARTTNTRIELRADAAVEFVSGHTLTISESSGLIEVTP